MKKIQNILTISLFSIVIFGFCVASIISPDKDVSYAERRRLEQVLDIKGESVFSDDFSEKLENYLLDQFPLREKLRSVNAQVRYNVLNQKDVNGLWVYDGSIFKDEGNLDKNQVLYGTSMINRLCDTLLYDMNVYYSVIPDKNFFLDESSGHKRFDYDGLFGLLGENINGARYIDIIDTLELDDYYKTDTHWRQEKLIPTVQKLAEKMGVGEKITPVGEYTQKTLSPFYGVYWGQAALSSKPDTLYYLTDDYTDNAKVYGIDPEILKNKFGVEDTLSNKVYAEDKFFGLDGYDIFLSGAQPIVTIETTNAKTDRELIIFRDSYGSSIAPLFTGAYSKITLVDLRYIPSVLLSDYVDFKSGQDVLFLYSTMMLNSSMLMK